MKRWTLVRTMRSGRFGAAVWALGAVALAVGCGDLVIAEGTNDGGVVDVVPDAGSDEGKEPTTCEFGNDSECDDGDSCTTDRCLSTGVCSSTPREGVCKVDGVCWDDGASAPGSVCQVCDTSKAVNAWTPVVCDDGDPCTDGKCDAQSGCFHVAAADETPCDDGVACTTDDRCVGGQCVATPCGCGGDDGECEGKVALEACQRAACVEDACVAVADASKDGKACQGGDLCVTGETCLEGVCQGGAAVACEQEGAEVCQVMTCNLESGECEPVDAPDDEACDPGDPCIVEATCQEGECVGAAVDCSELNGPCATGVCEGGSCEVALTAEGQSCVPADECVIEATCTASGSCVGKWDVDNCACVTAEDCDDGQVCTIDGCDGGGVCQYEPVAVEAGSVGGAETVCPGATPAGLTSVAGASGGVGEWTYQWQSSADGEGWAALEGATGEGYAPGALTATTWFRRQAVNQCATVASEPVVVTVAEAMEAGSIGEDQTLCPGETAAVLASVAPASGGIGAVAYAWESRAPGGAWAPIAGATGETYAPGAPAVTTEYRRRASGDCGSVTSNAVTVTVQPTLEPGSIGGGQALCQGATPAGLTSAAGASGGAGSIGYQWQQRAPAGAWQDVAGATGATYAPESVAATTEFRRLAVDGCGSAPSNVVTVTVAEALEAGAVGGGQTICQGANAAALSSAEAASGGLGTVLYQWESRAPEGAWAAIGGATGATYAPGAVGETTEYRRRASNDCGEAVSNAVTVAVDPAFDAGSVGGDQAVCHGATPAGLTSSAGATGGSGASTYQWQARQSGQTSWANVAGATGATHQPGAATVTTEYRRGATNSCGSGHSNVVTVSVHGALSAGTPSGSQTICHGATPSQLTVSAPSGGSGGFTFQWQSSPNGSTWSDIAGATGASYQPGALTANTQYRRVATNGCGSVESASIAIAVHGALNAGSVSANQSICSGAKPAALTGSSPSGGSGSFSYQWQSSTNGTSWSNVSGATSSSYAPGALTTTTQFRRVASNSCGSATSNAVTVTVASGLTAGGIGNPQSICYGGNPSALSSTSSASGGLGNITYQWQQRPSGGSWSNISGATSTTYNPGVLTTTTEYRRQASNTCGTVTSNTVTVTVAPKLDGGAIGYDQWVCPGGTTSTFTNVTSASGGSGSIAYQWQRRQGTNAWENISGATSATYKPSNLPYEYRRAASNSCGTAYSNTVKVELLPYDICNPCNPICP